MSRILARVGSNSVPYLTLNFDVEEEATILFDVVATAATVVSFTFVLGATATTGAGAGAAGADSA